MALGRGWYALAGFEYGVMAMITIINPVVGIIGIGVLLIPTVAYHVNECEIQYEEIKEYEIIRDI
jgi:hypothetical protein